MGELPASSPTLRNVVNAPVNQHDHSDETRLTQDRYDRIATIYNPIEIVVEQLGFSRWSQIPGAVTVFVVHANEMNG
jgi:hypothetical protein